MDEKRTKEELLAELESIKDLLDSDPLSGDTFFVPRAKRAASSPDLSAHTLTSSQEIPTLSEMVLENEPFNNLNDEHIDTSSTATNEVLPGQQSQFEQERLKREEADTELDSLNNKSTNTASVNRAENRQQAVYSYSDRLQQSSLDSSLDHSVDHSVDSATENPFLPKHIRERLTKPSDLKAMLAGDANKRFLLPPIVTETVDYDSTVQRRFFSSNDFLNTIKPDSSNTQSLESALNKTSLYKSSSPVRPESEVKAEPKLAQSGSRSDVKLDLLVDELIAQYLPEIEAKLRFQLKQALMQPPQKK
jgi:hypothetical protein